MSAASKLQRGESHVKALILAGGKGTRLRPLTHTIAKHLLPVANKPILFYVIENIKEAGIDDIGIVVSPETGQELKNAVSNGQRWGVRITYILQSPPLGIAHAVKTAREFLGDSPFLLFLGDNLIKDGVKGLVEEFNATSPDALIVLKEVADPRAFGVAEVDDHKNVIRVEEKPKEPKSNLALVGAYIFKPLVHPIIDQLTPSWRGEYEITDAIQQLLVQKKNVRSHILQGWWLDTGKKEDLLEANHIILDEYLTHSIQGQVDDKSRIVGRVQIDPGSVIEGSHIRGPVSIAANCRIISSLIGPYTSIGADCVVENSSIDYSVIMNNSYLQNVSRLADSVIGRNTQVIQRENAFKAARLFIGDYARVEL
jgi:glucose-1-phosphate thymidylyltransferase